jgi:hypothetical protein
VTITNTDEVVQFQSTSHTTREDAGLVRIAVTRGEGVRAATVDVNSENGTATAGQDYTAVTNKISFAPGETLKFVDVPLINDGLKESSETFRVLLSNPIGGAMLGTATRPMSIAILDNDPGVGFESSTNSVAEDLGVVNLQVARGNDELLGPFTVDYQTVDATAKAGIDYQAAFGTLTFGSNEMFKSVSILLLRIQPRTHKDLHSDTNESDGTNTAWPIVPRVTILDTSGFVDLVEPPIRAEIQKAEDSLEVLWQGPATILRSPSATGPWEQLGALNSRSSSSPTRQAPLPASRSRRARLARALGLRRKNADPIGAGAPWLQ